MEDRAMRLKTVSRKMAFMSEVGDDDKAADLTGGGHADVVDNGTGGSSAEVGASMKEKWTLSSAAGNMTSMTAKGGVALRNGEARFCRVSPIVAKPPPLLAAVFPWDREEVLTVTEQEGMVFPGAGAAGRDDRRAPWKGGDQMSVVEVVEELSWVVMNPTYGLAQRTALSPSFFSRNENENDRELLTPMLGLDPNWMSILQAHLQIKSDQQVIQRLHSLYLSLSLSHLIISPHLRFPPEIAPPTSIAASQAAGSLARVVCVASQSPTHSRSVVPSPSPSFPAASEVGFFTAPFEEESSFAMRTKPKRGLLFGWLYDPNMKNPYALCVGSENVALKLSGPPSVVVQPC
ncbi:hypothetical protein PIB30_082967 [Stylosanthes scabra]|uniref:Uncharacterized protein n=1 Tax=Stylosanthes scabra TaxID=79078 RepID=A0ABU6TUY5_9FABA|nr:hypothetical protein [Stylosanthes scabra]